MAKKKIILPKIKSKPKYTIELDEDQLYALGGWMKENNDALTGAGTGALSGAATGFSVAGPWGALVGGLIGGVSGAITGHKKDELEDSLIDYSDETRMPRTVGKQNMTPNVMSFAKGGKMKKVMDEWDKGQLNIGKSNKKVLHTKKGQKQAVAIALSYKNKHAMGGEFDHEYSGDEKLMQLQGPKHEEGGIQFTPDSELEGGESVYKDVVNSDQVKITKEIATRYGLAKTAINKTPAEYSDMIESRYKGREVDPFAQTSKEMELNNLARMSSELSEQFKQSNQFHYGGGLPHSHGNVSPGLPPIFNPQKYNEWKDLINSQPNLDWGTPEGGKRWDPFQNNNTKVPGYYSGIGLSNIPSGNNINQNNNVPIISGPEDPNNPIWGNFSNVPEGVSVKPNVNSFDSPDFAEGQLLNIKDPQKINRTGNPWNAFNVPQLGNYDLAKGDANKLRPNKISLPDVTESITDTNKFKGSDLLGMAPLAIGAFQAARTAAEGYDKVKLGRVHAEDYNPEFIDPQYQLNQVSDTFATGNEQMNQVSRKDYLRRRIQSATEESKVKSGVLGQVNAANTQMLNQSRQFNQQNRTNADRTNLQMQMQEENINAANKGAYQTARDYQLSNLASMAGEYGRDKRLEDANDVYNERMFGAMKNLYPGQTYDPATGEWLNTGAPLATQDTSSINTNSSINKWQYSNDNVYGDNVELGQGLNNYPYQVNRMVNGYRLPGINLNRTYIGR